MRPANRRKIVNAVALSALVHTGLLAALVLHAPRLHAPEQPSGPPPAIIPVLILPKAPPPPGVSGPPAPIRLHRRRQRLSPEELPVAPLVTREAPREQAPRAPSDAPATLRLPQVDDAVAANAQKALRGSVVGCANARALGLSRAEIEECERRLAAGAKDAPFRGLGLDAEKETELGRAAARKDAYTRYRNAPPPPGVSGGSSGQSWDPAVPPTASDRRRF